VKYGTHTSPPLTLERLQRGNTYRVLLYSDEMKATPKKLYEGLGRYASLTVFKYAREHYEQRLIAAEFGEEGEVVYVRKPV